jgi:hypothetical protein
MPTYQVDPPPYQRRKAFMDALEEAGIDYHRDTKEYLVYLKDRQVEAFRQIHRDFDLTVSEDDPMVTMGM